MGAFQRTRTNTVEKYMNKMSIKNNAQAGFTLIELIVVIVILGILAATALPKFSSLGGDARLASLNAAKGAMSATAAMAKGKFLVNTTGQPMTTLNVEGVVMNLTDSGYPKADLKLAEAAGLSDDYTVIASSTANTDFHVATAADEIMIVPRTLAASKSGTTCYLKYKAPATKADTPAYTLVGTTAGCE